MDAGVCREIVFPCGGEVAADETFRRLVRQGTAHAQPSWLTLCT